MAPPRADLSNLLHMHFFAQLDILICTPRILQKKIQQKYGATQNKTTVKLNTKKETVAGPY